MRNAVFALFLLLKIAALGAVEDNVVLIGHPGLSRTDQLTVQRVFSGRSVSLSQQPVVPFNLPAGHPVREQFLASMLGMNEGQYTGYWLVRRYVGKGTPPEEVRDVDEMLRMVASVPGAVGYVPASAVPQGANVIFRP